MKWVKNILLTLLFLLVIALATFLIAVQFPAVQRMAAQKGTQWLSTKTGTTVHVGNVRLLPFTKLILSDVSLEMAPGDTLFSANKVSVTLQSIHRAQRKINLQNITINGGGFHLYTDENGTNITRLVRHVQARGAQKGKGEAEAEGRSTDDRDSLHTRSPWTLSANSVRVEDFCFTMYRQGKAKPEKHLNSIDFADMDVRHIYVDIDHVQLAGNVLTARLSSLNAVEKSGYVVKNVTGHVTVDGKAALIEDLLIEDPYSTVKGPYFKMEYGDVKNFKDYINNVNMAVDMDDALLSFQTIQYFAGNLNDSFSLAMRLTGLVEGTVSRLHAEHLSAVTTTGNTQLECAFKMVGLTKVPLTTLQIDITQLHSTFDDVNHILEHISGSRVTLLDKNPFAKDRFQFNGRLAGLLTDFAVDGLVDGAFGQVDVDMVINSNAVKKGILLDGRLQARQVDINSFTGNPLLGKASLDAQARAAFGDKTNGIQATIDSLTVSSIEFNGYTVGQLHVQGDYDDGYLNGTISCTDPSLRIMCQGEANLNQASGIAAHIQADMEQVDLNMLNLIKKDSVALASGHVTANFERFNSLGDIKGHLGLDQFSFTNSQGVYQMDSLVLTSDWRDSTSFVTLRSDALTADFTGSNGFLSFVQQVMHEDVFRHLHNFFTYKPLTEKGTYTLDLTCLNTTLLEQMLMPGLYVADGTTLHMHSHTGDSLSLSLNSNCLGFNNLYANDVNLTVQGSPEKMRASLLSREAITGLVDLHGLSLVLDAQENDLVGRFVFSSPQEAISDADLTAQLHFDNTPQGDKRSITLTTPDAWLTVNGKPWTLATDSLVFSPNQRTIAVNRLKLFHVGDARQEESLLVNGLISPNATDTLAFQLDHFDISLINRLIPEKYPYSLRGAFTGSGQIVDLYQSKRFFADITGEDLYVNDTLAGDLHILSAWIPNRSQFRLQAVTTLPSGIKPLYADGYFRPSNKELHMTATLDRFPVTLAAPLLKGMIYDAGGSLSGTLYLDGPLSSLDLTTRQDILANNVQFTLDYTRVPYVLNGPLRLSTDGLTLPGDTLRDQYNHFAIATGGLRYKHFKDIRADLDLQFTNLHGLATTQKDNEDFYGNAFATGNLSIKGPLNDIRMDLAVRTEPSTVIHIPLSSGATARQTDLLTFKEAEVVEVNSRDPYARAALAQSPKKKRKGLFTFNMKTEVTPDAEMRLEINKTTGDVITGRGRGMVTIGVDPKQDNFSLLGDCTIEQGTYLFNLQGLISKRFDIVSGGTITFNGDIENTQLNMTASYTTKASLNTLLADTTSVANRRNVDCQILMSGYLMNPSLGFNIEIADIDPTTQARVESALNTDDKMMRQFMTLLVSSSFMPDQESGIVNNSNIFYSNATEILSNQLNNILSQLNIPVDVGFNYQPSEGEGRDVFDVAISTQLFNNRVIVNGNMGNNPYTRSNNDLIGNVDIELKLDEKGKFRIKAFSHAADQYSNYLDNTQRNGGGFVYQDEFTTFGQLWQQLFGKKKKTKGGNKN